MIRSPSMRPCLAGAMCLAMLAAACSPRAASTAQPAGAATLAAPPGSTPPVAVATFGPFANATLSAIRDAPDLAHQCTTDARQALKELATQYPFESLVRQAARDLMPKCKDQASLAELLETIPRNQRTPDEQMDLIRLYVRNLSRFADAEAEVKPLVDADPNNTDTLSLYAAALYYQGRFAEAKALVDRRWTVLVREENTDILTMRADQFMKDGRPERADAILRQVLSMNPGHMFAINTLRQVKLMRGDSSAAAELAATAEAIDSLIGLRERSMAQASERFQDLVAAFDAFDYATAESIAKELIESAVDDTMRVDLYESLATIYLMQGHTEQALEARNEASRYQARLTPSPAPTGARP